MILQPALPIFFADVLQLSYTDLMVALSMCRGVGYAATSQRWACYFNKINIFSFSAIMMILLGTFMLCLLCAQFHVVWVFVAYLVYGTFLAGNHLSWNLSGPIFSREDDSSKYSSVNVVTVGLRGCIAPPLGGILCFYLGPISVIIIGISFCFYGCTKMFAWGTEWELPVVDNKVG
jgi:hypothetical protein